MNWGKLWRPETNVRLWIYFTFGSLSDLKLVYCSKLTQRLLAVSRRTVHRPAEHLTSAHTCTPASLHEVHLQHTWLQTGVENVPKHHNTKHWICFKSIDTVVFMFLKWGGIYYCSSKSCTALSTDTFVTICYFYLYNCVQKDTDVGKQFIKNWYYTSFLVLDSTNCA